jgi:peptidyl-prolyl cis-trans isomerase C
VPEPDEQACRRHHAAHAARYRVGERVRARHILFAVTPGVEVDALRSKAEGVLVALRCATDTQDFADQARVLSNCPSGEEGGELGWIEAAEVVPEFAQALFAQDESAQHVGVLPRLVHTRFGFHIIDVQERDTGFDPGFDEVRARVAQSLHQQAYVTALRQYLQILAGKAELVAVALDGSDSPLVQ